MANLPDLINSVDKSKVSLPHRRSTTVSLETNPCVCLTDYLPVCLSVCLSVCLPALCMVLSFRLSVCLPVCLSVCLSVCLFACLHNLCLAMCTVFANTPRFDQIGIYFTSLRLNALPNVNEIATLVYL